jgi:hypothetical protein
MRMNKIEENKNEQDRKNRDANFWIYEIEKSKRQVYLVHSFFYRVFYLFSFLVSSYRNNCLRQETRMNKTERTKTNNELISSFTISILLYRNNIFKKSRNTIKQNYDLYFWFKRSTTLSKSK